MLLLLLLLLLFATGCYGLDIGPNTCKRFAAAIAKCNTIFWNGPMGRFEVPGFAKGTLAVAQEVGKATERGRTTILGGEPLGGVQGTISCKVRLGQASMYLRAASVAKGISSSSMTHHAVRMLCEGACFKGLTHMQHLPGAELLCMRCCLCFFHLGSLLPVVSACTWRAWVCRW
jgi:hypothetical protein